MKNWFLNIVLLAFGVAITIIIVNISMKDLTLTEATLLSVLLTFISVIASWVASSYFSELSHSRTIEEVRTEYQNNLHTYALNAAEKVDNLSNELTKLALYLKSELDREEDSDETALLSKIERIQSAIHIVNTLKSVNDTSLSDWKGVIGEELEEREEEKEERENRLIELTERIEGILSIQNQGTPRTTKKELDEIKEQLSFLNKSINVSAATLRNPAKKSRKEDVEQQCPNCENILRYTQKSTPRSRKVVKCSNCEKRSISRYGEKEGFFLIPEQKLKEEISCPWCENRFEDEISNLPFTKQVIVCDHCTNTIKVVRKVDDGLTISKEGSSSFPSVEISQELLDRIEEHLPKQPWPVGVHRLVAQELGVSNGSVYNGISKLIEQGKFNPQVNGVVFVPSDLKREK